ncbi:alpha/beta fold hydrolase [Bacillus sp. DJP31]|uniref:alpha/beta fold hydrolase n=1 Tax=Bacillus sp. DJP31 TaxID=3409789 RepID=UPI003BB58622
MFCIREERRDELTKKFEAIFAGLFEHPLTARKERGFVHRHSKRFDDLTLSYIDEGSGEVLVLLHGFCGSPAYWEKIIPALSEGYRVIAPALRGHGKSSAVCDSYTIEDMSSDVKRLLEELQIDKVIMFGHSLGGYVTLSFAEQYPEHLSGFSLVHSTAHADSDEAKNGRTKTIELIGQNGIEPLIKNLVPKLFAPKNLQSMTDEVELVSEIGLNTSVSGAKGALWAMRERLDRHAVLSQSKVPILLIAGEFDQIIPKEKVFSVESSMIKQIVLEDAGHMGMVEKPKELATIMQDFIKNLQ